MDSEWEVQEGDDVVLGAKRLHCIVLSEFRGDSIIMFADSSAAANNLNEFKPWLAQQDNITVVAHNLLSADLEVFRRLLGIPFTVGPDTIMSKKCTFIDTFTLSKRLNPDRPMAYYKGKSVGQHGLKAWGVRLGILKPEVEDWVNQPIEVYLHRCEEDVKINEATYEALLEESER
tara:strand:+ start:533 stop:1057 length:525 start_codon:yes stop_codon:yes gene_type:complete